MSPIYLNNACGSHAGAFGPENLNRRFLYRLGSWFCFVMIGVVSVFDMYFVGANPDILQSEQNPICLALMNLEPNSKIFFFVAKSIGLIGVLLTLRYLFKVRYRHATTVLLAVSIFQVALLSYLCLGDSRIGGCPNFALLFQNTPESIFRLKP